jgi:hypothetical protein
MMNRNVLIAALGGLLIAGPAASIASAQFATAPLSQPGAEAAPPVPAGDLALGSVRIPRKVTANGEPLAAGTYQLRLTGQEASGNAPGATPSYERFVEFVRGGKVVGKEVASIVAAPDIAKVAKGRKAPSPGSPRVEMLKGNDYLRVWINRGGNNYLVHLVVPAA